MKIYLAHSAHEQEQGKEIEAALVSVGYDVCNPFDKENPGEITWMGDTSKEIADWVVEEDYKEVDASDIVVCIYPQDGRTIGIPCEMARAYCLRDFGIKEISIYSYVPDCVKGHPWPIGQSTKVFQDLFELLNHLKKLIE